MPGLDLQAAGRLGDAVLRPHTAVARPAGQW